MKPLRQFFRIGVTVEPEEKSSGEPIALQAGEVSKIEVGRSGKFRAMGGVRVTLNPKNQAAMAAGFDPKGEHKAKIGHKPIETDTPDFGDVVSLEYDQTRDRLIAGIKPTEALVEKNRKEGFRRVSMELDITGQDSYELEHVSFLGAKRPAIDGLAPALLAGEEKVAVCCAEGDGPDDDDGDDDVSTVDLASYSADERKAMAKKGQALPDGSFPIADQADLENAISSVGRASDYEKAKRHIVKRAKELKATDLLPAEWPGSTKKAAAAAGGTDMELTEEQKAKLARVDALEAESKRNREGYAKSRVKLFLESDKATKKIPLKALRNPNLERFLVALAMIEAPVAKVALLAADGKTEADSTLYEAAEQIFMGFPDKLTDADGKEIAGAERAAGEDDRVELPPNVSRFDFAANKRGDVKFAKSEFHDRVLAHMAAEEKAGRKTTYTQASEAISRADTRKSG